MDFDIPLVKNVKQKQSKQQDKTLTSSYFLGANLSQKEFYNLLVTQFTTLLGGAFSFITALALNDAIQTTINRLIPEEIKKEAITIKFLYAGILLLVVLLLTVLFAWIQKLVSLDPHSSSS